MTSFDAFWTVTGEAVAFVRYDYESGPCDPEQVNRSVGRECFVAR